MNVQRKKRTTTILFILSILVVLSAIAFVAFFDLFEPGTSEQSHGMFFQEDSVTVEKFETCKLELQGAEGKAIEWKSKNEEIATVQDGVVCGWMKGNTQILACIEDVEVCCNVSVLDNQYVPVIELRESDEIMMDIGSTYGLSPVLHYNGNVYTDVQYTFSCTADAVTVEETGVITAVQPGEALVSVQGTWRSNAVDATLTVYVIDASTSIEVSDNVFDIYLNGKDEEYPSSVDVGISVFDQDEPIQEKDASVKYTELIMEGDVGGAATIKNGVAHAAKIGTTHFVAEYTSLTGEVVRSAVFTVNVHKTPADIYMSPIAGAEYESFISPMNAMNSVKWVEDLGAFHLVNVNDGEDDGRAFILSRDYIEKIIQYTNAKSIVFEVKSDGISSGCPAPDQVIYQGFYPEWYDANDYMRIDKCGEWTKIEVFFDKIPLDADGNRKSIMLLSTKEGMYVRNIRPMTEGLFLTMDLEMTTLGGNWNKDIEIGLYPHSYKGDINGYNNRVTINAGVKTTVKVRLDDFLEGGKVPGFGLVVYGGPAWDAKLPDGTSDRHTLKISNLRVTGERSYSLDLSTASWATGKDGTGFTNANGSGIPSYEDGAIVITNGFCYDGHKFTLDSEEAKNRTYLYLDMDISTLSGEYEAINIGFYPYNFAGDINDRIDIINVPTGSPYTVKLDASKYLIDGELPGIGFAVLGGPAWDAKLPDGTPDRHNIAISNFRLEGASDQSIDLSRASLASGTNGTGYTNANAGGTATVEDGVISVTNGFFTDGYKITFKGVDTFLKLDMDISTLGGNYETIRIGFYPYDFAGDINDHIDAIEVPTESPYTVKLDASKYLIDGELPGIGFAVLGGPAWDAKLPDGTPDRHNITVSNFRLDGETDQSIDLSKASLKSGQDGTGYTNANAGGTATVKDGVISVANGFFTDGYKITFVDETIPEEPTDPPATEQDTYLKLDMDISTLSGEYEAINIGFYPYNFAGDINNHMDIIEVPTESPYTVKLDASKYLIDGELPGIGFAVLGGPAWDAKLPDGTPDRHNIIVSNFRLEGESDQSIDLSRASLKSGQDGTGYTNANAGGTATVEDGIISVANGFFTDGYKITFVDETIPEEPTDPPATEPDTTICIDMQLTTLGGSTDPVEVRFYPYNYEGSVHSAYTDKVTVTAGTQTTVKLELSKYLVDGELPGIGFAIFGGPEWNTQIAPGQYDRHSITISGIYLEGGQSTVYDLSKCVWAGGNNGTGYTDANGSGTATIGSQIVITNGFRYDGHKISLSAAQEPPAEEEDTYLTMDMLLTTLGGSTDPVDIRLYNYNYEGSVGDDDYTGLFTVTAGTTTKIKVKADDYLVDGKLPGFGFAIFGGPEWNTQLADGTYDRHTVVVSNVRLEGAQEQSYDLNSATVANGTNGTGFTWANSGGTASIADGKLVITSGYRYDAYKITLPETQEPPVEEDTYLCMDMLLTTLGGSTDPVDIRLYNYNYEGSVGDNDYTGLFTVTAGTTTKIKVKVDDYLVDGKLPGFGFAIFGGPEWNTQLAGGTYDRHTVVVSNVRLEGAQEQSFDLNGATVAAGTNGTGFTWANSGGTASIADGEFVITGGYRYDAYEITFATAQESRIAHLIARYNSWVLPATPSEEWIATDQENN